MANTTNPKVGERIFLVGDPDGEYYYTIPASADDELQATEKAELDASGVLEAGNRYYVWELASKKPVEVKLEVKAQPVK